MVGITAARIGAALRKLHKYLLELQPDFCRRVHPAQHALCTEPLGDSNALSGLGTLLSVGQGETRPAREENGLYGDAGLLGRSAPVQLRDCAIVFHGATAEPRIHGNAGGQHSR